MPTDYRSMFEKDYLGAWDFTDGDKTFTIKKVQRGELVGQGGRKTKKPVIYFDGIDKGFALNATNGKTIAALYGVMVEDWRGKKITLYRSRTTMGSEEVDCVRVRPQAPKAGAEIEDELTLISDDQATELELLCTEGGRDLSADFKERAGITKFAELPLVKFKGAKKWIGDERGKEMKADLVGPQA